MSKIGSSSAAVRTAAGDSGGFRREGWGAGGRVSNIKRAYRDLVKLDAVNGLAENVSFVQCAPHRGSISSYVNKKPSDSYLPVFRWKQKYREVCNYDYSCP